MITQVIETKRQPPLWTVKVGTRIKAAFSGVNARAQAEAYATENYGAFEMQEKPMTGKDAKRLALIASN